MRYSSLIKIIQHNYKHQLKSGFEYPCRIEMDSWTLVDIQDFKRTMRGEMDARMSSMEINMEEEVRELKNMIEVKFDKDMGEIRNFA